MPEEQKVVKKPFKGVSWKEKLICFYHLCYNFRLKYFGQSTCLMTCSKTRSRSQKKLWMNMISRNTELM